MQIPNQAHPIPRGVRFASSEGIEPSLFCGVCKTAVGGLVTKFGCEGGATAFEVACNAALDWIPGVGEGPSEVACTAGAIAIGAACNAAGGKLSGGAVDKIANTVCSKLHLC